MTTDTDANVAICEAFGIDVKNQKVTAVTIRLRVGKPPTITISRLALLGDGVAAADRLKSEKFYLLAADKVLFP